MIQINRCYNGYIVTINQMPYDGEFFTRNPAESLKLLLEEMDRADKNDYRLNTSAFVPNV